MVQFKVKENLLCMLLLLSGCNSSFIKNSDTTLSAEATETPDLASSVETITEENFLEAPDQSDDGLQFYNDETQPIETELRNGLMFRLMMTFAKDWNDDFSEKSSIAFYNLATELGEELKEFVDEKLKLKGLNGTEFKLVEASPSQDSLKKMYATFLVSSINELSGEDLSNSILNQINLYEGIIEHKVTNDGFVLENISEEEAKKYDNVLSLFDAGKKKLHLTQELKLVLTTNFYLI